MSNVSIALGSLVLMLVLIYSGMHVAITLGLLSFIGVWLIRDDGRLLPTCWHGLLTIPLPATSLAWCRCLC